MKKEFIQIIVSVIMVLGFIACEKEELENNNRDLLVGSWNVIEKEAENDITKTNTRSLNDAYMVSISKSEVYESEVLISNFFQLGNDFVVNATIDGKNIEIPQVTINEVSVRGSGTISGNKKKITWSYWVDMGDGNELEYQATYNKQNV